MAPDHAIAMVLEELQDLLGPESVLASFNIRQQIPRDQRQRHRAVLGTVVGQIGEHLPRPKRVRILRHSLGHLQHPFLQVHVGQIHRTRVEVLESIIVMHVDYQSDQDPIDENWVRS